MVLVTPHVADVGLVLEVLYLKPDGVTPEPIDAATTNEIKLRDPEGVVTTHTASFSTNGTDGLARIVTSASTLSKKGSWDIQGHLIAPGVEWHSEEGSFTVRGNL